MTRFFLITVIGLIFMVSACEQRADSTSAQVTDSQPDWKQLLDQQLPLLGHRNWILVVDKAFPLQTSNGMTYVNSGVGLPEVLTRVLDAVDKAPHVAPILYRDAEMALLDEQLVPGVDQFKQQIDSILGNRSVQQLSHDAVFTKMAEAAALFGVLVIKTEETIPYSSLFIQLDCGYWDADHERQLRMREEAHQ